MTLPKLEPFRSTFGDCGCETRAGHRSYGSDSDRNTLEISGSLQSFSARCNHYSSLFEFCEFMDFPSIGTIETGAAPRNTAGGLNEQPTAYILLERAADGLDVDNQIFQCKILQTIRSRHGRRLAEAQFFRSLRLTVTFIPSITPMCSSQESAAE